MAEQFSNAQPTTLSGNGGSITSGATSFKVASVAGFPTIGNFRVLIDSELILVGANNGVDTFSSCTRNVESTSAASHSDGAAVTQVLTAASLINAITDRLANYEPKYWTGSITATIDQDVASSTVVANDNELKFDMDAAAPYEFELTLSYNSPAGGGTPDIKYAFAGPATLTGTYTNVLSLSTADAAQNPTTITALTTTTSAGTAATARIIKIFGGCYSTAGGTGASGFFFQWAQATSGINPTRRLAGSTLRYRKLV
jgi:hypothetical protein